MKPAAPVRAKTRKQDPVVHFEIPSEDSKRMSAFYARVFGWKTETLGKENGHYVLAFTTASDRRGQPMQRGIINGGFFRKDKNKPAQFPSVVIAVESIKKSMAKVERAGGQVLGEPISIPEFGLYVSFYDTEGNRIAMLEPMMTRK